MSIHKATVLCHLSSEKELVFTHEALIVVREAQSLEDAAANALIPDQNGMVRLNTTNNGAVAFYPRDYLYCKVEFINEDIISESERKTLAKQRGRPSA